MRSSIRTSARLGFSGLALAGTVSPVGAQLANASAAASALAGSYTALARNFNAAAWNPANLGLPGNSRFSLAVLPFNAGLGTGPVTPAQLKKYEGAVIPDAAKREWVRLIAADGGQSMTGEAGVTWVALNMGRIGLQASTGVFTTGKLSPALMEVLLFGNAGFNNGTPKDYALGGSTVDASVLTTIGLSYAQPVSFKLGPLPNQTLSLGGTAKLVLGNGLVTGIESAGQLDDNPLAVRINFPILATNEKSVVNGQGLAFDVGAAWQGGPFRAGAVVRNLYSTFAWATEKFTYRPLRVVFTQDSSQASADSAGTFAAAPANLQARVKDLTLKPTLAVGGAFTGFGPLTLAGEFRQELGDGLKLGAKTHAGLGAELRIIPFIPLRAGIASVTGGTRTSGGLGLEFGLINLQLSGSVAKIAGADEGQLGLTLSFGGR